MPDLSAIEAAWARMAPPTDRHRTYEVVVFNDSGNIYRGFGLTLARVIAEESEFFAARYKGWVDAGRDGGEFIADEPDRVVWKDPRAVAILRPTAGGTLTVIRVGEGGDL